MKARSLQEINIAITLAEAEMKKYHVLSPLFAASKERLRKAREAKRVFSYHAKAFTKNGHTVRH